MFGMCHIDDNPIPTEIMSFSVGQILYDTLWQLILFRNEAVTMITELTIQQKKTGRLMYVFQATLEYLISILITGTYLATITDAIGISDSLTGIISSIVSLGCLFQMGAVFLPRKRQKRPVIILSLLYQALFLLLYLIPLSSGQDTPTTAIFTVKIILESLNFS